MDSAHEVTGKQTEKKEKKKKEKTSTKSANQTVCLIPITWSCDSPLDENVNNYQVQKGAKQKENYTCSSFGQQKMGKIKMKHFT